MSDNASSVSPFPAITDNQQGSRPVPYWCKIDPSETTRRPPFTIKIVKAYLQGALHDGTFSSNRRHRISQKGIAWPQFLKALFNSIGSNAWVYREGKNRDVYVMEMLADFLDFDFNPLHLRTNYEKAAYLRGFFDSEGGVPKNIKARFYIQLTQKDKEKIRQLKVLLKDLGIDAGKIHNPSYRVDPNYWRIFILAESQQRFIREVGSWHPRKSKILVERVKI